VDPLARDYAARDFKRWLQVERRLAPRSVNLGLASLDSFFTVLGLGQPRVRRELLPQAAPRALDQAAQRQLLRAAERASARDRALVGVMLFTALRISEAVALDLEDLRISTRKGEVVVRSGKGDAGRTVPLNAVIRDMLKEWLAERRALEREQAVFVTRRGGRLSARSADDAVRKGRRGRAAADLRACAAAYVLDELGARWRGPRDGRRARRSSAPGHDASLQPAVAGRSPGRDGPPPKRLLNPVTSQQPTARGMGVGYPSKREADRLERWPQRIELEDLREFFAFGDRDRELVFGPRGAENRLGLAVQLCALRFLGFVPDEITGIPEPALRFLCEQTETQPHELLSYGEREQTRSNHLALVRDHLHFRVWEADTASSIREWLLERALEQERPSVLMSLLCEHLRARLILRPSVWVLARLIGSAREAAHDDVLARLADQLPAARCHELDRLLDVAPALKVSQIAWLRTPIGRVGIKGMLEQVAKYRRLGELAAADVDLSALPPSRRRHLAAQARRLDAQQLQRRDAGSSGGAVRRHPILLVALAELHLECGDELLDVFCKLLASAQRRANTAVDRARRKTARTRDDLADLATTLSRIVLEESAAGRDPTARITLQVGLQRLRDAAGISKAQLPPLEQEQLDVLHSAHHSLTRALTAILDTVALRAHDADQPLLDALELVRRQRRNRFLTGARIDLLPREYRGWVLDEDGRVQRTRYELGLWCAIRDALRDGRLFRTASRKYLNPAAFLLPDREWARAREELAITFGRPLDPAQRLHDLEVEQTRLIEQVQLAVDQGDRVRLDDQDRLISSPPRAEPEDPAVAELKAAVVAQIPEIELADLLIEVDQWTAFSEELRHAAGATPRAGRLHERLYAAVVASGTLLGPVAMARICDLSYRQIAWAEEWYLDVDNVASASQRITGYHHQHRPRPSRRVPHADPQRHRDLEHPLHPSRACTGSPGTPATRPRSSIPSCGGCYVTTACRFACTGASSSRSTSAATASGSTGSARCTRAGTTSCACASVATRTTSSSRATGATASDSGMRRCRCLGLDPVRPADPRVVDDVMRASRLQAGRNMHSAGLLWATRPRQFRRSTSIAWPMPPATHIDSMP